jgi:hypothetical protein
MSSIHWLWPNFRHRVRPLPDDPTRLEKLAEEELHGVQLSKAVLLMIAVLLLAVALGSGFVG